MTKNLLRLLPRCDFYSSYSSSSRYPRSVKIVEVGPRDGLQNESKIVPTNIKLELIERLENAGFRTIEVSSCVSPKWVPQMADHGEIMSKLNFKKNISFPVLVPNVTGLKTALSHGVREIAVFVAASEGFSKKNTNCTINESLDRVGEILDIAGKNQIRVRGYLSCVVGCPYDGLISPQKVLELTDKLLHFGCYEVSLGDTIGVGTPGSIGTLLQKVTSKINPEKLAIHCHDTYGQALANVLTSLEFGIAVVDSSVAGLGGCPYAEGATGNLATEDLIYMLHGMNIETGVDLEKVVLTGRWICQQINKSNGSRVGRAF